MQSPKIGGGGGGRGRSCAQRKHFKQSGENVWKCHFYSGPSIIVTTHSGGGGGSVKKGNKVVGSTRFEFEVQLVGVVRMILSTLVYE